MKESTKRVVRQYKRERRSQKRLTTVLRVGLLSVGGRASFCVVKNISPTGVQVRVYTPVEKGEKVLFRVGDGGPFEGNVIWKDGQLVGIEFDRTLDPALLLRPSENHAISRRRSSPRVQAIARATLRTGGRTFAAELCDISAIGTKLKTHKPVANGSPALLTLPDLPTIRGYVRWSQGLMSGFMFECPLPVPMLTDWLNARKRVSEDMPA